VHNQELLEENLMNENLLESKNSGNKLFEGTNPLKDSRTGCFGRALFSWATPLVRVRTIYYLILIYLVCKS
jgi:hypothetical protein